MASQRLSSWSPNMLVCIVMVAIEYVEPHGGQTSQPLAANKIVIQRCIGAADLLFASVMLAKLHGIPER